jgi:hypothetical protein
MKKLTTKTQRTQRTQRFYDLFVFFVSLWLKFSHKRCLEAALEGLSMAPFGVDNL